MTATTIKVSTATRDRLKRHAHQAGDSLGDHIDRLLDAAEREERFAAMRTRIAAMTDAERADYVAERDLWLDADLA